MRPALFLALSVATLLYGCGNAEPLLLVTPDEAEKPAARGSYSQQSSGPEIVVILPKALELIASPFPIHIEFNATSPAVVNMNSLKLTYMKLWGIDITDRVRNYISGTSIAVPETEMPKGRHTLEIYIEDKNKNVSTRQITINVQPD